jgi:hypothetical protein
MASFAPYNGKNEPFPSAPYLPTNLIGLSMPGERSKNMVLQSFQGFCSPLQNDVRKVPGQFYTMSFEDAYKQYVIPKIQANYNLVPRTRKFPIQSEFVEKSYSTNTHSSDVYNKMFQYPNTCNSDFCRYPGLEQGVRVNRY